MGRKDDDGRIRVLIAGGGTGGHLYPAIAVARELLARPEGCDVLMAGTTRGLEARILPEEGLPLATIRVSGLKGKGPLRAA
ncbi:MAG TPA: glycosyltransferase, partial [Candidatus Saccharimonadales bacterium]|nr:glycosyltransferase [Candidatus Saccharimonadales bacterium]